MSRAPSPVLRAAVSRIFSRRVWWHCAKSQSIEKLFCPSAAHAVDVESERRIAAVAVCGAQVPRRERPEDACAAENRPVPLQPGAQRLLLDPKSRAPHGESRPCADSRRSSALFVDAEYCLAKALYGYYDCGTNRARTALTNADA